MFGAIARITKAVAGKCYTLATGRSSKWPTLRKQWLEDNPRCEFCGGANELEVHHVYPVSWPEGKRLELDPTNLVTMCREHHFWIGHLGSWSSRNETCLEDCVHWRGKIRFRPRPWKAE